MGIIEQKYLRYLFLRMQLTVHLASGRQLQRYVDFP